MQHLDSKHASSNRMTFFGVNRRIRKLRARFKVEALGQAAAKEKRAAFAAGSIGKSDGRNGLKKIANDDDSPIQSIRVVYMR
eukprot:scaffold243881_cov37-Prasinocladus_malaysianus.AAC.1